MITVQNFVAVSHGVWVHIGGPKNILRDARASPSLDGLCLTPMEMLRPHKCYRGIITVVDLCQTIGV